jgi:hypothetical protein
MISKDGKRAKGKKEQKNSQKSKEKWINLKKNMVILLFDSNPKSFLFKLSDLYPC